VPFHVCFHTTFRSKFTTDFADHFLGWFLLPLRLTRALIGVLGRVLVQIFSSGEFSLAKDDVADEIRFPVYFSLVQTFHVKRQGLAQAKLFAARWGAAL